MSAFKITIILLLVLVAMRGASWAVAWIMRRAGLNAVNAALMANVICFGLFVGLLYYDLYPGEPMDWSAVGFGAAVFGGCAALDLMSIRRKARTLQRA